MRELPAFTNQDRKLLAELASQLADVEILQVDGKRLWTRMLDIVKTSVYEVAIDPGESHGIRLTKEMILGMVNKYGSNAEGQNLSQA